MEAIKDEIIFGSTKKTYLHESWKHCADRTDWRTAGHWFFVCWDKCCCIKNSLCADDRCGRNTFSGHQFLRMEYLRVVSICRALLLASGAVRVAAGSTDHSSGKTQREHMMIFIQQKRLPGEIV